MARRVLRGWARRFSEEGDEHELNQLLDLRYELDIAIRRAILEIRARGEDVGWHAIAEMTGMKSAQAARQKFDLKAREAQREIDRRYRERVKGLRPPSSGPTLAA